MSAESGAEIRYTLDGSNPSASSTLYSSAITLSATTTVKAVAIKDGITSSVTTKQFTKSEQPVGDLQITVDGVAKNVGDEINIDQSATIVVTLPAGSNLIGKSLGYSGVDEEVPSGVTLAAGENTMTLSATYLGTNARQWGAGTLSQEGFTTVFTFETLLLNITHK